MIFFILRFCNNFSMHRFWTFCSSKSKKIFEKNDSHF